MSDSIADDDPSLVEDLNGLLRIGHDAEEAYTAAIGAVADAGHRRVLIRAREDHRRHVAELARLIRRLGGRPADPLLLRPGSFTWGIRAVAGLGGDREILSVLRANEEQLLDSYRRHARRARSAGAVDLLRRHAEDEERHCAWLGRVLDPAAAEPAAGDPWPDGRGPGRRERVAVE